MKKIIATFSEIFTVAFVLFLLWLLDAGIKGKYILIR